MSDVLRLAIAKRDKLKGEVEKLNDFIRMAERLMVESNVSPAGDEPQAAPSPARKPVEAEVLPPQPPKTVDQHRTLSSVLRDVDDQVAESAPETARRTGLWRATNVAGVKG